MQEFIYKHKKALMIAGVVGVILIVIVSTYFVVMDKINSATVNVMVTPSIAKVKVGDRVLGTIGEYKIQPGEYIVEVSAEGFETKTGNLVAVADETVDIKMFLTPTDAGNDWYETHELDALILGEIKSAYALEALQALKDKNPILNQLPVEIDYYTDNYAKRIKYTLSYVLNEANDGFVITITDYTGGNRELAMARLKNLDADVSKYTIKYTDESAGSEWGHAF